MWLPFKVGHIKRLQHGVKDIQQGRLPPRLLQCVTISFPATSTPSLTTASAVATTVVTTSAITAGAGAAPPAGAMCSGAGVRAPVMSARASASPSKSTRV